MALRNDVTVDFSLSPRIITVAAPSVSITIQDLYDTLRSIETGLPNAVQFPSIVAAGGKDDLGGGATVGITLRLLNAQLAFAARGGPSFIQCDIGGGNLVAVDINGVPSPPINPTAFTQVVLRQSSSPTIVGEIFPAVAIAELTSVPSSTPTIRQVLAWLYQLTKNKVTTTATQQQVRTAAGAVIGTSTLTDDGTTFTRDEFA